MDKTDQSNERTNMTTIQTTPVIPAHPNIVEMVALLEEPQLKTKERVELQRVLHDTVHLVKKRDVIPGVVRSKRNTSSSD